MGNKRSPRPVAMRQSLKTDPTWSPEKRAALVEYLPTLVRALRLSDWEITVNFENPATTESYAEIRPHVYQKRAEVRFGDLFHSLDAEGVRQTLVHELLHCHLFGPHHLAESLLEAAVGEKRASLALVALDGQVEQATDDLANAFAPLLPLPPAVVVSRTGPDYVLSGGVQFVGVAKEVAASGVAVAAKSSRSSKSSASSRQSRPQR